MSERRKEERQARLRQLPQVDRLLGTKAFELLQASHGSARVTKALRACLEAGRAAILANEKVDPDGFSAERLAACVDARLLEESQEGIVPVINATGILLHTNLGRAPLSKAVAAAIAEGAQGYCNLEYRLKTGRRGSRYDGLEALLCELTGAEAALVVNNNAAAVMLILDSLAKGKEVILSRSELVEIGGSFRIPDVMRQSGAILREVGTSNKTHVYDYEGAINAQTGILLKVHQSNFCIRGFTKESSLKELRSLADQHDLPLVYDMGLGLLHPDPPAILRGEKTLKEAMDAGCDLICFSGDKLMGGPQAGMIVGKKALIEQVKKNQLTRALRVDKLCLLALQSLLRIYLDPDRIDQEIPFYQMLAMDEQALETRGKALMAAMASQGIAGQCEPCEGAIGGGSAPGTSLSSLAFKPRLSEGLSLQAVLEALRLGEIPVVAYVDEGALAFDLRTIQDEQIEQVAKALAWAVRCRKEQ